MSTLWEAMFCQFRLDSSQWIRNFIPSYHGSGLNPHTRHSNINNTKAHQEEAGASSVTCVIHAMSKLMLRKYQSTLNAFLIVQTICRCHRLTIQMLCLRNLRRSCVSWHWKLFSLSRAKRRKSLWDEEKKVEKYFGSFVGCQIVRVEFSLGSRFDEEISVSWCRRFSQQFHDILCLLVLAQAETD